MNVIDRSEFRDEEGVITLENRIRGTLQHGLSWYGEMQAQEFVSQRLDKSLDRAHTLLRNVVIPGTNVSVSMILLSPQGIRVLEPSSAKGVFRAKGEEWLKFDGRGRRFKRARPNLQEQTLDLAQLVHRYIQKYLESQGYLEGQEYNLPEVEAVLLFANPRTHIDTARPRIRIVQADAIDHFAANLLEFQPIMDQEDIDILIEALIEPKFPELETTTEAEAELEPSVAPYEFVEEGEIFTSEAEPVGLPIQAVNRLSSLPFTRSQWILLAAIVFFELIILIIFAMLILSNMAFG
ncbi:MAG: hypothetical protein AMJ88_11860 [Anaerolineae bacterium SM23_ 63]|nr:MAG: hypothetical protein AMJ88_11860 [Anaerolineae bacterium SM23_ 63]HEY46552.1 hypothetical protein [Anaerolineae bacterium]